MNDARQGVPKRRLRPIRRVTPERESSSDASIYAMPGSPRSAELVVHSEVKQPLWKRPPPETSNSRKKRSIAIPSPDGKLQTIRELLDNKNEPKARRPKRLKKIRGFAYGGATSIEHTRVTAIESQSRERASDNDKDEDDDESVDPAALEAMNAFVRQPQKPVSAPQNRLEVQIPARRPSKVPKSPSRLLKSSGKAHDTVALASPKNRAELQPTSSPPSSAKKHAAGEITRCWDNPSLDLVFEGPESPQVDLDASPDLLVEGPDFPRVALLSSSTLTEETSHGNTKVSHDPEDTSEYEFDDEPEDDYIFPDPASKAGKSNRQVRNSNDTHIPPKKQNESGVNYPVLDLDGLDEIELPRYQPRSRRKVNVNRQAASDTPSDPSKKTNTQEATSPPTMVPPAPLTRMQDPMLVVEVPSTSLRQMRNIIGFNLKMPWAEELQKNLATDTNPSTLSEHGRKLFRYIRILKRNCERAPRAPKLEEQTKWLESRRSDYDQYHLSIHELVSQIMDSRSEFSNIALTEELSHCIVPALFLVLWATFTLGGVSKEETGVVWPSIAGRFTHLVRKQLVMITSWICDLVRILSEKEDDQLWIHRTANSRSFNYYLSEFLNTLEAPTKQPTQTASSEYAAMVERKRKEAILEKETALRAANERVLQRAKMEKELRREAMCQSTLEMREKLRLGQIQMQRALGMVPVADSSSPGVAEVSAQRPLRAHGLLRGRLRTPPSSMGRPVRPSKPAMLGNQSTTNLQLSSNPPPHQPARLGAPYPPPDDGIPSSSDIATSDIWALEDREWLAAELMHCDGKPEPHEIKGWAEILDREIREVEEMVKMLR